MALDFSHKGFHRSARRAASQGFKGSAASAQRRGDFATLSGRTL
jgi:hypothetical protein